MKTLANPSPIITFAMQVVVIVQKLLHSLLTLEEVIYFSSCLKRTYQSYQVLNEKSSCWRDITFFKLIFCFINYEILFLVFCQNVRERERERQCVCAHRSAYTKDTFHLCLLF